MVRRTIAVLTAALLASACGGGGGLDAAPRGDAVLRNPNHGPPGCSEWAAHGPTAEERADGCIGANADMYLDAVAAVSWCEDWLSRTVSSADVARGCRAGPVDLAFTADQRCTDGRTLFWNQAVWGFVGEEAQPETGPSGPPEAVRSTCSASGPRPSV